MEETAFLGLNGYVWWIGVVEDRKDPLNLGRCRVRIFGWHNKDLTKVPTKDLPWAQAELPVNNTTNLNTPKEGDWVRGYFMDGKEGKVPVMCGFLPGIPDEQKKTIQQGFKDQRTSTELATSPAKPASTEARTDGSGATTKNQPAKNNPVEPGKPTTNKNAINDPKDPPPQVVDKIKNTTNNIRGPNAASIGPVMAGAVQGIANALNGTEKNLQALLPDAEKLAASIKPPSEPQLSALAKSLSNTANSIISSNTISSLAKSANTKQQGATANSASSSSTSAQASASKDLSTLLTEASKIAEDMSKNLSARLSANINTKTPVVLEELLPKADLAAVKATTPKQAPNQIPDQVPLNMVNSSTVKSLQNSMVLFQQYMEAQYKDMAKIANSSNAKVLAAQLKSTGTAKANEIATAAGDTTIFADLKKIGDNFAAQIESKGK